MNPVVLHLLLCDDVRRDPAHPLCVHINCLQLNIVSVDDPPFPLRKAMLCIYASLTELRGRGLAQIRVAWIDDMALEVPLFGTPEYELDFTGRSPLEVQGFTFRLQDCTFPREGDHVVQFCYNGVVISRTPLRLRART
jgi:hypothetical protein